MNSFSRVDGADANWGRPRDGPVGDDGQSAANGVSPFETVLKQGVFALLGIPLMFIVSRMLIGFRKRIHGRL